MKFIVTNNYLNCDKFTEIDLESQIQEFFEFIYNGRSSDSDRGLSFILTKQISENFLLKISVDSTEIKFSISFFKKGEISPSFVFSKGNIFTNFYFSENQFFKTHDKTYPDQLKSLEFYGIKSSEFDELEEILVSNTKRCTHISLVEMESISQIFDFLYKFFIEQKILFYFCILPGAQCYNYQLEDCKEILRILEKNPQKYTSSSILDILYYNYPLVFYLYSVGQLEFLADPSKTVNVLRSVNSPWFEKNDPYCFKNYQLYAFDQISSGLKSILIRDFNKSSYWLKIEQFLISHSDSNGFFECKEITDQDTEKFFINLIDNLFTDCLVYEFPLNHSQKTVILMIVNQSLGKSCKLIAAELLYRKGKML